MKTDKWLFRSWYLWNLWHLFIFKKCRAPICLWYARAWWATVITVSSCTFEIWIIIKVPFIFWDLSSGFKVMLSQAIIVPSSLPSSRQTASGRWQVWFSESWTVAILWLTELEGKTRRELQITLSQTGWELQVTQRLQQQVILLELLLTFCFTYFRYWITSPV